MWTVRTPRVEDFPHLVKGDAIAVRAQKLNLWHRTRPVRGPIRQEPTQEFLLQLRLWCWRGNNIEAHDEFGITYLVWPEHVVAYEVRTEDAGPSFLTKSSTLGA